MQIGKVRVFKKTPDNQFGFATVGKDMIFFHPHYGGVFVCDGGEDPVFVRGLPDDTPMPKPGDELVIEYDKGPKGLRATKWAYLSSFTAADVHCQSRPTYRLVHRMGFVRAGSKLYSENRAKFVTLWEGKDLPELRKLFPKTDFRYRIHNEEQSSITIQYLNEETQEWVDCSDPR